MTRPLQGSIAKSRESLEVARLCHGGGYHDVAVSRAYYAMFYAAEGALSTRGLGFSSHQAVVAAFGAQFVKDGTLARDVHRLLAQTFPKRTAADYGDFHTMEPQRAAEVLADAERFLAVVLPWLEGKGELLVAVGEECGNTAASVRADAELLVSDRAGLSRTMRWTTDPDTDYWARRLPFMPKGAWAAQDAGDSASMLERTWRKRVLSAAFPETVHRKGDPAYVVPSPRNIVRCFQQRLVLEGLALAVRWGTLTRAANTVYREPLEVIQSTLEEALTRLESADALSGVWKDLVERLGWTPVIASKTLHFMTRALGYDTNGPVPIDNAVILDRVWPAFEQAVTGARRPSDPPVPAGWARAGNGWAGYNRYMSAVLAWAEREGKTTGEIEAALFNDFANDRSLTWPPAR